jgi:hypothetical protein
MQTNYMACLWCASACKLARLLVRPPAYESSNYLVRQSGKRRHLSSCLGPSLLYHIHHATICSLFLFIIFFFLPYFHCSSLFRTCLYVHHSLDFRASVNTILSSSVLQQSTHFLCTAHEVHCIFIVVWAAHFNSGSFVCHISKITLRRIVPCNNAYCNNA